MGNLCSATSDGHSPAGCATLTRNQLVEIPSLVRAVVGEGPQWTPEPHVSQTPSTRGTAAGRLNCWRQSPWRRPPYFPAIKRGPYTRKRKAPKREQPRRPPPVDACSLAWTWSQSKRPPSREAGATWGRLVADRSWRARQSIAKSFDRISHCAAEMRVRR